VKSVIPIHYDLEFEPDFRNFTFNGKEQIQINCKKPTNKIILNAAELKIKSCNIRTKNDSLKAKTKLNKKNEELQITFIKKIKGKAVLEIDFVGILNDKLLGFYRSKYKEKGTTKYLATTQFEAADARRAFPCWDEPAAKATFGISIITDKTFTALSNMPESSHKKIGKKILHKFAKTPIMSTYLIYLGVGEFEFLKGKAGRIQVRIVTTKGNKFKAKFSLDLTKKFLLDYEKYFGIKYPLPKLDMIAVPDFAAGAMENWGAITFRETILLYDPKTSSTQTKQRISEVISHELAHQWFGNLVTMEWWNDLWLNESFATFMATKFVDRLFPEWEFWDQFLEDAMNIAMGLDALKSSHPIDVKVRKPSEIREIFDAISYDKGGCILRMVEHYVGESNFRKGLKNYLTKFKYQNAKGDDLWTAIGKVAKKPVHKMVKTWVNQIGFPIVQVKQVDSKLELEQKRFMMVQPKKPKGLWHIPVSLNSKKTPLKLVTKKSDKITISSDSKPVVNSGRHGFYRVKYDDELLDDLKQQIENKTISSVDRWSIQNDLFALCVSGVYDIQDYLDFSEAYEDEDNYLSTHNVASNLNWLFLHTYWEDFSDQISSHASKHLRNILENLGWDKAKNEKHTTALLRSFVISALGKMDDEEVQSIANEKFNKFLKNPDSLNPDIRQSVFTVVAWHGDSKTHRQFISLYKKVKTIEEKLRYLTALCYFKDEKLLLKSLDFSQTSEVRSQNMQLPIMTTSANPHGKKILWPWLKKNWKKLSKKVGHGNPLFNRIVASIALIADEPMKNDIKQFFKKNPTPGTERTLEQVLEKITIHSRFLERMRKEFNN